MATVKDLAGLTVKDAQLVVAESGVPQCRITFTNDAFFILSADKFLCASGFTMLDSDTSDHIDETINGHVFRDILDKRDWAKEQSE